MPTYPINLPASPMPREIEWQPVSRVAVSASPFTGSQQVYAHPGQWWELSIELPPLGVAAAAEWAAAMLSLNGREGTFRFAPTDETPRMAVSGTVVVDAVSDRYIDVTGMTGTLSAGDWVQIETGLYRITTGDTAAGDGTATVEIWPAPRADIQPGTSTVDYTAPQGVFRLAETFGWEMDVARVYGITIAAREAL